MFELVARRLVGYAVGMEVARRPEGPEVNGDLRKTVSRRSLVPSRELKAKGLYSFHTSVCVHTQVCTDIIIQQQQCVCMCI